MASICKQRSNRKLQLYSSIVYDEFIRIVIKTPLVLPLYIELAMREGQATSRRAVEEEQGKAIGITKFGVGEGSSLAYAEFGD